MVYDVIIVGGNFAGLAAAMQLVRARKRVLVIDANSPRNRFAKASHGVFGLDGKSPEQIRNLAFEQLFAYPTFELWEDTVDDVTPNDVGFSVATRNGEKATSLRLILASGIFDKLPDIEGLSKYWGKNVVHCPYCHGYELSDRKLGVLATSEMSSHQAAMVSEWGPTTFFTQGTFEPEDEMAELFEKRNIAIERSAIVAVKGNSEMLNSVSLEDGRDVHLGALYVGPSIQMSSALVERLGLEMTESPLGVVVKVDAFKESSLKGLFVAGDLSNPMQNGTFAIASGTMAGVAAHRSLIFE